MKKLLTHIISWFKNVDHVLLTAILLLASFMRLYKISEYLIFLGDEGRDVIVAREILQGHLVFIGPRASAGDFFLGPIYYYFMAPFLWIWDYSPVGPAVMVALFGIATTYLVYLIGKKFFGRWAGLAAAALYAISPLVVTYSRSSWNPNPVPFFTLLMIYFLYNGITNRKLRDFLFAGACYGILIQLHYIVVFLAVIVGIYFLIADITIKRKFNILQILKRIGIFSIGFVITFSPFLAFEIKNHFPNFKTIFKFITSNTINGKTDGIHFHDIVSDVFVRVFSRLLLRFPDVAKFEYYTQHELTWWKIGSLVLAAAVIIFLFRAKNRLAIVFCILWLVFGIVLFGFYKKPIYDYYFGFLFPLPFLLFGNLLTQISRFKPKQKIGVSVATLLFISIFAFVIAKPPTTDRRNNQLKEARTISDFILNQADKKPFNFALITRGNSDYAFRYFFDVDGNKAVEIDNLQNDPKRTSVTDQLYVLCDYKDCSPLGYPQWEVAGFGRGQIVGQWPVVHFTVYKIVHYKGK